MNKKNKVLPRLAPVSQFPVKWRTYQVLQTRNSCPAEKLRSTRPALQCIYSPVRAGVFH